MFVYTIINCCIYNKDRDMSKAISIRLPDQVLKAVKAYAKGQGVTVTDIIVAGINSQIYNNAKLPQKEPCQPMAAAAIVDPASLSEAKKPVKTPIIKTTADIPPAYQGEPPASLRAKYKIAHPLALCIKCQRFNRECICP